MDVGIIKQVLVEDEHALKCVSGGCEDVDSVCLSSLLLSRHIYLTIASNST